MIAFFTGANLDGPPVWETFTMDDTSEHKITELAELFGLGRDYIRTCLDKEPLSHVQIPFNGKTLLGCNFFVSAEYGSLTPSVHGFREASAQARSKSIF